MAWWRHAASHCLSQCWPLSMSPYGGTWQLSHVPTTQSQQRHGRHNKFGAVWTGGELKTRRNFQRIILVNASHFKSLWSCDATRRQTSWRTLRRQQDITKTDNFIYTKIRLKIYMHLLRWMLKITFVGVSISVSWNSIYCCSPCQC